MQKPSAQDKARSKTAVLAAGVQEDLGKMREKLTVNDVRPTLHAKPRLGGIDNLWSYKPHLRQASPLQPSSGAPASCRTTH